jgi:hypothetical protein
MKREAQQLLTLSRSYILVLQQQNCTQLVSICSLNEIEKMPKSSLMSVAITIALISALSLECDAFVTPSSTYSSSSVTIQSQRTFSSSSINARRRRDDDDDYYYDDEDDDDDDEYEEYRKRSRRRPRSSKEEQDLDVASPFGIPKGMRLPNSVSQALLAGVFVLGIGTGVTVDSQINTSPKDLASRDAVDQAAPNSRLCSQYGASAMAFDQRVFVSFNPFNVYVAQADVKPACVLREANVVPVLQDKGLINTKEVRACKQNMNTWAFVGDLNEYPQLSCVYRSEDAQNEFLSNPKYGIGEDVWDDDRAAIEASKKNTNKKVKGTMTEGEKLVSSKAAQIRKDTALLDNENVVM